MRLATVGSGDQKVASRILRRIVHRRKWSVHRHVHLVAAFEQARAERPIDSVLSVGSGSGLSETFLAVSNPEVHFTLTEPDEERFRWTRPMVEKWGIHNVTFATQDLLFDDGPRADFVAAVEVLEHIEDDETAARNLLRCARRFAYVLLPYCSPEELADPRLQASAWRKHEHHRVGYTHASFDSLLGEHHPLMRRNCYFMPAAMDLRSRMAALTDDETWSERSALVRDAVGDIQDRTVTGGMAEAVGIETLLRVEGGASPVGRSTTTGRWS